MHTTKIRRVLTLVADPLPSSMVQTVVEALASLGASSIDSKWLAPQRACDLSFACDEIGEDLATPEGLTTAPEGLTTASLGSALRHLGCDLDQASQAIDWVVQSPETRDRRLLVADMESTVIHNEMLDELAEAIGRRQDMAAITARAMNDEIDFEDSLRQRVAWLEHLPQEALRAAAQKIVIDPGAAVLVATLKQRGVRTVLASGGFTFFAQPIADRLGFDACSANVLDIVDGHLTGKVVPPVLDPGAKVRILRQHCQELGIAVEQAIAVGDGANDLPMLQLAGLGVAYHGKPRVAAAAPANIRHGRLDRLLFFMGVAQSEWVGGNGVGASGQVR